MGTPRHWRPGRACGRPWRWLPAQPSSGRRRVRLGACAAGWLFVPVQRTSQTMRPGRWGRGCVGCMGWRVEQKHVCGNSGPSPRPVFLRPQVGAVAVMPRAGSNRLTLPVRLELDTWDGWAADNDVAKVCHRIPPPLPPLPPLPPPAFPASPSSPASPTPVCLFPCLLCHPGPPPLPRL